MSSMMEAGLQSRDCMACIFFLTALVTPRFTLFPYTTLFRSVAAKKLASSAQAPASPGVLPRARWIARRSEEHTSELQSRLHLVCRLLLEKKNVKHHGLRATEP